MTQAVSITCPSCDAVLKVTKTSLMGKRVACPNCKEPVRIPLASEATQTLAPAKAKKAEAPLLPSVSSGDDLDNEHHRVLDQHAWVELDE